MEQEVLTSNQLERWCRTGAHLRLKFICSAVWLGRAAFRASHTGRGPHGSRDVDEEEEGDEEEEDSCTMGHWGPAA